MPDLAHDRKLLPTYEFKQDLIDAIREHAFLVIIGETGSGKTTQIPQYILEEMPEIKKIGVTQPRRIAAITVSKRVSEEQDSSLGKEVGYTIRFDDRTSSTTRLKYMTDGILLREAVQDPMLSQYSVVIVDEAHERTLETDVLFGLLKQTHRLRPDLKILVMSATLDVEKFSDFFDECPIFEIPGRTFPVQIVHHQSMKIQALKSNFVSTAVETAFYIHTTEQAGDILVFLTGQADIERACQEFGDKCKELNYSRDVKYYEAEHRDDDVRDVAIYPLFASLETMEQRAVFEPARPGKRKVVFATNVAQTSVTIPGIKYVVDSGFVKEKSYDPNTGMDALLVTSISQAAATQRAGRAGRTAPGKAYRLYSSDSYDHMAPDTVPEIQRSSLLSTVLALKRMNIVDILHFEFIDKPDETLVMKALTQLFLLGAIDHNGVITDLGKQMNSFPLSPYLSRVIISSAIEHECSEEVLTIASILAGDHDLFRAPSPRQGEDVVAEAEKCKLKLAHHTGDHMTVLNVWRTWRDNDESKRWSRDNWVNHKALVMAKSVRSQLIDIMKDLKLPLVRGRRVEIERSGRKKDGRSRETVREVDAVPILKSFLTGYYTNVANKATGRSVFSHYSPDQHFGEKTSHSSSALVALHLHPLCSLSDMFDRNKTKYSQIDWVMYMHVTYTNKAVMKGVSKILLDWVRSGKGHERIRQLASANLNGESAKMTSKKRKQLLADDSTPASSAESSDTDAGTGTDAELEEDRKRLRKLEIDKIRERALARRNLN